MPNRWTSHRTERLTNELSLRNYSPATGRAYEQAVRAFLDHSPGDPRKKTQTAIRDYMVHLDRKSGLSASTRNLHRYALTFFYRHVLKHEAPMRGLQTTSPNSPARWICFGNRPARGGIPKKEGVSK